MRAMPCANVCMHACMHSCVRSCSCSCGPQRKKRRGGRRLRKMKERYGLTDMRKAANRLMFNFNEAEEEYIDGDEVGRAGQDEDQHPQDIAPHDGSQVTSSCRLAAAARQAARGSGFAMMPLAQSMSYKTRRARPAEELTCLALHSGAHTHICHVS